MAKAKISADDLKILKERGYVEGNPATIPENISPVLRDQLVEEWAKDNDVKDALELPTAVDAQNQMARDRAAGDADPLDHDGNGVKGGVKRQKDI